MKYEDILNIQDLIVAPIYLILLIFIAQRLKKKYTRQYPEIRRYFMPALYIRFFGCFCSALMYQYYYHGGDTFTYFNGSVGIWNAFWHSPGIFIDIYSITPEDYPSHIYKHFASTGAHHLIDRHANMIVMQIGGLLSLITLKSYLAIGLIITFFSFLGCWKIFEVFYNQYPHLHKKIALAALFIPSVFFWGSAGLMKDTIIMATIGYTVWGVYYFFIKRQNRLKAFFYLFFGFYIILILKTYIALALFPSIALWVLFHSKSNFRNKYLKVLFFPIILILGIISSYLLFNYITSIGESKYSPENIINYAQKAQSYHARVVEAKGGVGYDLGEFDPSLSGMLYTIPKAINVTLFRPYLWESKKIILIPSAIESLITFLFTIFVFLKVGFFKTIRYTFRNPDILFCLSFSLIFSVGIGFSTYVFGALVRYKIPCLPFYFVALFLLLNECKKIRYSKRLV